MDARRFRRLALGLCLGFVAVAYLPFAVRILRADDFIRILDNPVVDAGYLGALLVDPKTDEFYRPLNHLSFGLCHRLFGLEPAGYAAFNAALVVGCVLLLFPVTRAATRSSELAAWAVFAWLLNAEIVMAPLWYASGRTTGLEACFLLLAAWAVVRLRSGSRWWLAAVPAAALLALLGKESALPGVVLLPVLAWWLDRREPGGRRSAREVALGALAALVLYAGLRFNAGSMLPWTAPEWYRFDVGAYNLVKNLGEYLKDSLAFSALALPALLVVRRPLPAAERLEIAASRGRLVAVCFALFLFAHSTTLALPLRSSLYPFLPSLFVALAVTGSVLAVPEGEPAARFRRRSLAAMAVVALLVTPLVWREGAEKVRQERHVFDWSAQIAAALAVSGGETVAVFHDPDGDPGVELGPRDFDYLEFALWARTGRAIAVLVNPADLPPGVSTWQVVPDPTGRSRARLQAGR